MKRVLIINDSGFERMVLRDQVQTLGYEVKTADEFGGLRLINKFHPDIVIANLTMTDISGDKLIEQIKNMEPDTRCLLSTCSKTNRHYLSNTAIDGLLETPVSIEHLEVLLNSNGVSAPANAPDNSQPDETNPGAIQHGSERFIKASRIQESSLTSKAFAFCPYCGEKLELAEAKFVFCPFCGNRL